MIPKSEVRTKQWLKKRGFFFVRAGRSYGLFDFWACNRKKLWFIQAKSNQTPKKAEMAKIRAFKNYPKYGKKLVFIWKWHAREPIIKKVR